MCVCVFVSVPFESVAKIAPHESRAHVQYSKDLIQDEMTEITKARPEGRSMAAGSTSVTSLEGAAGRCGATGSGLAVYVVVALLPPHLTRR